MFRELHVHRRSIATVLTLLTLLLSLLLIATTAHAATFVLGCTGLTDASAALQTSIITANSNGQPDTITLVSGCTYTLTATLSIYSDGGNLLTIEGNGATISGGGAVRIMLIEGGSNVILNNLTITDGSTLSSGGGIYVLMSTLTLNHVTVSNNVGNNGGGIYSGNGSTLTINNSSITGNSAVRGGGIGGNTSGSIILDQSTVSGNSASFNGGGINTYSHLTIQDSDISDNTASNDGGGIAMNQIGVIPQLTVQNSIIRDNYAGSYGGAINGYATIAVSGSCITGNSDVAVNVSTASAASNWWGTANGPGGAGTGSGDSVGALVDYSSFLTSPPTGCATLSVPTTTRIISDVNPTNPGQAVTFTATVSDGQGRVVSGTVTFSSDGVPQATVPLVSGMAAFSTSSLSPGDHAITASYNGDFGLVPSSATMSHSVLTPGITITPNSGLVTTEAGGTASFAVILGTPPTADVTLNLTSSNPAEGVVSPAALTFTPSNWNTPQTATITGVDDGVSDGDVPYTIVTTVTSADPFYSLIDPADMSAVNTDDDSSSISVSPLQLYGIEGSVHSYQIALGTMPSTVPVVIRLSFDSSQLSVNGSTSPVELSLSDGASQTVMVEVLTNPDANTDRDVSITQQVFASSASDYPVGMVAPTITVHIGDVPPPPETPLCEDHNFNAGGVVRSSTSDAVGYAVNCRVLYQNGAPTQWLGSDLYNGGSIGNEGVLNLGVVQAIDIFSTGGMTYFQGGAVFCLRGTGTLIWMAASHTPRIAEIIGSYTVPDFPSFTCATLFEPGTLVLIRQNPLTQ